MENISPNRIKGVKQSREQIYSSSNNISTGAKNKILKDFSIISLNRETYAYYLPILRKITGYNVKLFKGYPDDEEYVRDVYTKKINYLSNKKSNEHSCESFFSTTGPNICLSSVIDALNTIICYNDETKSYKNSRKLKLDANELNQSKCENGLTLLFNSFINYFNNQKIFKFNRFVKVVTIFIYYSRKYPINYNFQNIEDRNKLLFYEIVAFSDIFFLQANLKEIMFSNFKDTNLIQNLVDFHGKINQISASFDEESKRLIAKSDNIEIPINYVNGLINIPEQNIEIFVGKKITFTVDKKKEGVCSGLIIDSFYNGKHIIKFYCKELFCFSKVYQEYYQDRVNFFKQWAKDINEGETISISKHSKLVNICHEIPSYTEFNEKRYEFMASEYVNHFNPHVELFGYYLLRAFSLCPNFTVYRSHFDSKTYIIMDSLENDYKFCDNIDFDCLSNINAEDLVYSAIRIHYLKAIQQVFLFADFHEHNVALKYDGKYIDEIKIIDLFPTFFPLKIEQITTFEGLREYIENKEKLTFDEEKNLVPAYYILLNDFRKLKHCKSSIMNDILFTKKYRFLMLTYHAFVDLIAILIERFVAKDFKYDKRYSLCCFAVRALFDGYCDEIKQKQLISGEFKHKDDYINHVMGNIGMFIYQLLYYVNNDCFDSSFSIYKAHVIRYEDSKNWNKYATHYKDGPSYYLTSWRKYHHKYIKPNDVVSIFFSSTINSGNEFYKISRKHLKNNSDEIHIWVEDPISFDVCVIYFKNHKPRVSLYYDIIN